MSRSYIVPEYLFIDSTYRNRNLFPNPAQFNIPFRQQTDANTVGDAVVGGIPFESNLTTSLVLASVSTTVAITTTSIIENFYINKYLRLGNEFRRITAYTVAGNLLTFERAFNAGYAIGTTFFLSYDLPIQNGLIAAAGSTTTMQLANPIDLSAAKYIYYRTGAANALAWRRITGFNTTTNVATVAPAFTNPVLINDPYYIMRLSYDNAQALLYTGSLASQTQSIVCDAALISLSLPNIVVTTSTGGFISRYPFLYVRIVNTNMANIQTAIIASNAIPSRGMTFVCPVTDINTTTLYLRLYRAATLQAINWRFTSDIAFEVRLPDGSILTYAADDVSPYPACYNKQIHCVVEFLKAI